METVDLLFFQSNGFDFVDIIGKGSYGVIYKVYSLQYKMNFAMKRVPANKFRDSEIDCMIEIRSSSIVPLYQYFHYKEFVYLLMEYCPSSLDILVHENQNMAILRQYQIALGMIESVASCHETGISHGDIKPSNFLLDSNGRVKICDFGLSKKTHVDEISTSFGGTLMFLAPEIINKLPFDAFSADIWALGVSLYFLFTGRYPWPTDSKHIMFQSILNSYYDDSLIQDLFIKNLIRSCLNVNPTQRPQAKELFNQFYKKVNPGKRKICRPNSMAFISNSLILSPSCKQKRRISSI